MKITNHGFERGKQRLGLDKGAFERMSFKIFNQGLKQQNFKGRIKRYLDSLYFYNRCIPIIYGENVFMTDHDTIITCFKIPPHLKNYKKYIING